MDDGKHISLDDIVAYFKNDKLKYIVGKYFRCIRVIFKRKWPAYPSLKHMFPFCCIGKPKCFFVQACRGSSPQGAVDLSDDKEEMMIDEVVGKVSIPTDADLLIAYATTPGNYLAEIDFLTSVDLI